MEGLLAATVTALALVAFAFFMKWYRDAMEWLFRDRRKK